MKSMFIRIYLAIKRTNCTIFLEPYPSPICRAGIETDLGTQWSRKRRLGQTEKVALKHIHYRVWNRWLEGSRWVTRGAPPGARGPPRWVRWAVGWVGGSRGRGHLYTYSWFTLLYGRKPYNTVKQLSSKQEKEKRKLLVLTMTLMNLQIIMLSEKSQSQVVTYYMIPLKWYSFRSGLQISVCQELRRSWHQEEKEYVYKRKPEGCSCSRR